MGNQNRSYKIEYMRWLEDKFSEHDFKLRIVFNFLIQRVEVSCPTDRIKFKEYVESNDIKYETPVGFEGFYYVFDHSFNFS